jgi:hypothetical protein
MSTTLDVYPRTAHIPLFKDVVQLASRNLHAFLHEFGIAGRPDITVEIRTKEPDEPQGIVLGAPATWPDETYAWFRVPPVWGGTDGYFWLFNESTRELWEDYLQTQDNVRRHQDLIKPCLEQGYYWSFRLSASLPATVNVMYGFVASAFAELTEGFVFSDDGAWDYTRFPATAAEFNRWYFRPELALDADRKDWAERCIAAIPDELGT